MDRINGQGVRQSGKELKATQIYISENSITPGVFLGTLLDRGRISVAEKSVGIKGEFIAEHRVWRVRGESAWAEEAASVQGVQGTILRRGRFEKRVVDKESLG